MTSDARMSARPPDLGLPARVDGTRGELAPRLRRPATAAPLGTRVTSAAAAAEVGHAVTVAPPTPTAWRWGRRVAVAGLVGVGLVVTAGINPVAVGAALLTGFFNVASGGGAVVAFVALTMVVGVPALTAHATGQAATLASFLSVLGLVRSYWPGSRLLTAGCLGTLVGVAVLWSTPPATVQVVAPCVLVVSGFLVLFHGPVQRRIERTGWTLGPWMTLVLTFGCGVYAGVIGVGTGTLALVVLGASRDHADGDLHRLLLTRNVLLLGMAGVVSVAFIATGLVDWPLAAVLAIPGAVGGWIGVTLIHRVPVPILRGSIAATAATAAVWMWLR